MSKKKHQSFYEIGGLILGSAFDLIARPVKIPKGYKTKKNKYFKPNPEYYKITKTQEEKLKRLLPQIKNKELRDYTKKHFNSSLTRKKYKEIVNQIEKELKANELKLERKNNKKETGISETNNEKLSRERKNNKKETGISETNKERLSREEDERDDNFAMYGKYETNQEKILRIIKNKEFDREDRLLQKEEKESEYRISHLGPTFEELLELQRELEEKEREKNYKETGIKETDYEREQREYEEKIQKEEELEE